MRFDLRIPCPECPFRHESLAGWLGSNTPEDMAKMASAGARMPCHCTVDYEDPMWRDKMERPNSSVQQCAGALAAARHQAVLPRDTALRSQMENLDPEAMNMVMNLFAFMDHHNAAEVKSWEFADDVFSRIRTGAGVTVVMDDSSPSTKK